MEKILARVYLLFILLFVCSFAYADEGVVPASPPEEEGLSAKLFESDIFNYVYKMRDEFGVRSDTLLGDDRLIFVGGDVSETGYTAKLCVEQHNFLDEDVIIGVDIHDNFLNDKRYKEDAPGIGVYLNTKLDEYTVLGTELSYSSIDIHGISPTADSAITEFGGVNQVTTLLFKGENSPVDNEDYPTRGRKTNASFEVSSKDAGSDFNFLRTQVQNAFYYTPKNGIFQEGPLKDITFVLNGQAGWIKKYGDEEQIPFFERFYTGGVNTIRGYKPRYVSPTDSEGLPIGGNAFLVFNAEMRYPLYRDIKGVIFYDQGNTWKKADNMNLADTKSGIGTGLRWVTRFGTATLDYGYGLNSGTRPKYGRVHASLGAKF